MELFSSPKKIKLVVSCEHASHYIPVEYSDLFVAHTKLLLTHEGYDIGAVSIARSLRDLANDYIEADFSRLVVDLNRSTSHPKLFSRITKPLLKQQRELILERYYYPYRKAMYNQVSDLITGGYCVVHLSIHSFTPVLNGQQRHADIGLLYDPKRAYEVGFAHGYKQQLAKLSPELHIRFNYPYLGTSDGLANFLRTAFTSTEYLGIELELNQKFFQDVNLTNLPLQHNLRFALANFLALQ